MIKHNFITRTFQLLLVFFVAFCAIGLGFSNQSDSNNKNSLFTVITDTDESEITVQDQNSQINLINIVVDNDWTLVASEVIPTYEKTFFDWISVFLKFETDTATDQEYSNFKIYVFNDNGTDHSDDSNKHFISYSDSVDIHPAFNNTTINKINVFLIDNYVTSIGWEFQSDANADGSNDLYVYTKVYFEEYTMRLELQTQGKDAGKIKLFYTRIVSDSITRYIFGTATDWWALTYLWTIDSNTEVWIQQFQLIMFTPPIILNLRLRNIIPQFLRTPTNPEFKTFQLFGSARPGGLINLQTVLSDGNKFIKLAVYYGAGSAWIFKYSMEIGDGSHDPGAPLRSNIIRFVSSEQLHLQSIPTHNLSRLDDYNSFQTLIDNKFLELFNEYNAKHNDGFNTPYISSEQQSIRNFRPTNLMASFFWRINTNIDNHDGTATEIIQYNNGDTFLKVYLTYDTSTNFLTSYRFDIFDNSHTTNELKSSEVTEVGNLDLTDERDLAMFQSNLKTQIIEFIQNERSERNNLNDINPFSELIGWTPLIAEFDDDSEWSEGLHNADFKIYTKNFSGLTFTVKLGVNLDTSMTYKKIAISSTRIGAAETWVTSDSAPAASATQLDYTMLTAVELLISTWIINQISKFTDGLTSDAGWTINDSNTNYNIYTSSTTDTFHGNSFVVKMIITGATLGTYELYSGDEISTKLITPGTYWTSLNTIINAINDWNTAEIAAINANLIGTNVGQYGWTPVTVDPVDTIPTSKTYTKIVQGITFKLALITAGENSRKFKLSARFATDDVAYLFDTDGNYQTDEFQTNLDSISIAITDWLAAKILAIKTNIATDNDWVVTDLESDPIVYTKTVAVHTFTLTLNISGDFTGSFILKDDANQSYLLNTAASANIQYVNIDAINAAIIANLKLDESDHAEKEKSFIVPLLLIIGIVFVILVPLTVLYLKKMISSRRSAKSSN